MFASNTAEVLNLYREKEKGEKRSNISYTDDVFKQILNIHKRLKEIAQIENASKSKYSPAKLSTEQIEEIKFLETKLNCFLTGYQIDSELQKSKLHILNKICFLLDEYTQLYKFRQIKTGITRY